MECVLKDFKEEAKRFLNALVPETQHATVLALHGDLGSGKTTFVQELAKNLGVVDEVVSPTFVIQKQYVLENQKFDQLIHIDAYRLTEGAQIHVLNWDEISKTSGNLICIEWPENIKDALRSSTQHLYFTYIDEDTRDISYGEKT
tara:strand:- start:4333 stop:4767 length:435 start_codon:yes stop_codon:yes gene_type:complete